MPLLLLAVLDFSDPELGLWLLRKAELKNGLYVATLQDGSLAYLSVDPKLQRILPELYQSKRPIAGAAVAVDPRTGRVLCVWGYYRRAPNDPYNITLAIRPRFPAASVFKIITALAALEAGMDPDTQIICRGGIHSRSPKTWLWSRRVRKLTLREAFGLSANPVFGRLARSLGTRALCKWAKKFLFGPDTSGFLGSFRKPRDKYELMLTGAGFRGATLSPLHGALLASALATGVMLKPSLVDSVVRNGRVIYRHTPETLAVVMDTGMVRKIRPLLEATVQGGTAYRAFHDTTGSFILPGVWVGGKTGTLSGGDPWGRCEWFVGYAQDDSLLLAVSSLVVNKRTRSRRRRRRFLKGSQVAAAIIETFFGGEK